MSMKIHWSLSNFNNVKGVSPLIAFFLFVGIVCLYYGAEWLVRGSSNLALKLGISPLVIGLTVVAYGTSMPELLVSVKSSWMGHGDIAVGNVIGSNIINIALILGLSSMIRPLKVQLQLLKFDVPVMIFVTIIFLFVCMDSKITRIESALFLAGAIAYTIILLKISKADAPIIQDRLPIPAKQGKILTDLLLIITGLLTLTIGTQSFLKGSIDVAKVLGISEAVIGLTIVAVGTSLPELATSVVAACKKQSDISIGNIVGSNILNILGIIGMAGMISPMACPGINKLDLAYMLITALLLFPFMKTGSILSRKEGLVFIILYLSYIYWLWPK